jgi:DivIVA domain-containing protein
MLTITDITRRRFSEARMHPGYEMTEVDRFMAEIAEALYARDEEIENLRVRVKSLQQQAAVVDVMSNGSGATAPNGTAPSASSAFNGETGSAANPEHDGSSNGRASTTTTAPLPGTHAAPALQDEAVHQTSVSAIRLLEIATANAQQLVSEAKAEATSLLTAARLAADQLAASSREEADRVTAELAERRSRQEAELREHREKVLTALAEQTAAMERRIKELQSMERAHLTDLQGFFSEQMALLQARSTLASHRTPDSGPHTVGS